MYCFSEEILKQSQFHDASDHEERFLFERFAFLIKWLTTLSAKWKSAMQMIPLCQCKRQFCIDNNNGPWLSEPGGG